MRKAQMTFAWFFFVIQFLLICYAIPRGFDFSDEGLYAFLADPQQQHQGYPIQYGLFLKVLHQTTGITFDVIDLRIIRLGLYLLGCFFFALILKKQVPTEGFRKLIPWSILFIFSGFSFLPHTVSYNHLISILALGLVLVGYSCYIEKKDNFLFYLLLCLLLTITLYVKISAGVIFIFLFFLLELFKNSKTVVFKVLGLAVFIASLELVLYFLLNENYYTNVWTANRFIESRSSYHYSYVIKVVLVGVFWSFLIFLSGFIVKTGTRFKSLLKIALILLGFLLAFFVFASIAITDESVYIIPVILLFMIGYLFPYKPMEYYQKTFILLLIFLPFAIHFGSNVYFLRQVNLYCWPWGLALLLVGSKNMLNNLLIPMAFLITLVLFDGLINRPFGQEALWKQHEKWPLKQSKKSLILSQKSKQDLVRLDSILNLYQIKDNEIVSMHKNPGYLFLLGRQISPQTSIWEVSQLDIQAMDSIKLIIFTPADLFPTHLHEEFELFNDSPIDSGDLTIYIRKGFHSIKHSKIE